jgi:hypothetical protein
MAPSLFDLLRVNISCLNSARHELGMSICMRASDRRVAGLRHCVWRHNIWFFRCFAASLRKTHPLVATQQQSRLLALF